MNNQQKLTGKAPLEFTTERVLYRTKGPLSETPNKRINNNRKMMSSH